MNNYKLLITSQDYHGVNFIENIAKYSGKGAVIDKTVHLFNDYPHSCTMTIVTEEFLKSEPSVDVVVVKEEWSKVGLDSLDWEEFKKLVGTKGVTGRQRETMSNLFLKANEEV
jgi:hypothetical protein